VAAGVLESVPIKSDGDIDTFFEDHDGTVWAIDRNAVFRYDAGGKGRPAGFVPVPVPNLYSIVASIEVASIIAKALPMQIRGPAPNGMYW